MNWQPIETAPKDGTVVDLYIHNSDHDGGMRAADCRFNDDTDAWEDNYRNEVEEYGYQATHWMPPPEPPKEMR